MTKDEIDSYFKIKEWRYMKDAENVWHTGFRSRIKNYRRDFEFFLVLLDDWLFIRVPLLTAEDPACYPYVTEYLLGLNHSLFLAKCALQGHQIILTMELAAKCALGDLDDAIMGLDTYIKSYYLDIEVMATNRGVASTVHSALQGSGATDIANAMQEPPEIIFNN